MATTTIAMLSCYEKLCIRNRYEVAAYAELVEGYTRHLQQVCQLQSVVKGLENEAVQLRDERDEHKEIAENHKVLAQKGFEAKALQVKLDGLQVELGQSYKTNAEVSQQLVQATNSLQQVRNELEEKNKRITALEELLDASSAQVQHLEGQVKLREEALALATAEAEARRAEAASAMEQFEKVKAENADLIKRWMEEKERDAEKLNEANAMYEDMLERNKAQRLEEFAKLQVDGVVHYKELGADEFVTAGLPSNVRHTIRAHEGGCAALAFDRGSGVLFSGGHDRVVKIWETAGGTSTSALRGSLGSILDLAVLQENRLCLTAGSDNKAHLWEVDSGRIRHTFTGHTEKVVAVDFARATVRRGVTAAHDRTVKVWDLQTGYCVNTIVCFSNCNALAVTDDGETIVSGHVDGNLRFWDLRSGNLANEVFAHMQGITSVVLSRTGGSVLTNGRDNLLNLFDVRTFEARCTFRSPAYRVATNWSRACISPDDRYVAAGSADGTVYVWSQASKSVEKALKGHSNAVLSCVWSDRGRPLASADKNGTVITWE